MEVGDFIWFRPCDDKFTPFSGWEDKYLAGTIIRKDNVDPTLIWVAPYPLPDNTTSIPLWGLPFFLVKPMTDNEAMLAVLENCKEN